MTSPENPPELGLRPIGVVHSPFRERAEAPRQPRAAEGTRGTIELYPGHHYEDALSDLQGWEYIWVLFWFHLNEGWRPKVLPPRSTVRRGLFSTRTPHRPNPIGLSVLRLERVDGLVLHVADLDLLDGTPVLDIKPYVAWTDAIPNAREGWLEDEQAAAGGLEAAEGGGENPRGERGAGEARVRRPEDPRSGYEVAFSARAAEQLAFLAARGVELEPAVRRVLALGPQPHAYRRIRLEPDGTGVLATKEWRVRFRAEGHRVEVLSVRTGYRPKQLAEGAGDPALAVHAEFVARFGLGGEGPT